MCVCVNVQCVCVFVCACMLACVRACMCVCVNEDPLFVLHALLLPLKGSSRPLQHKVFVVCASALTCAAQPGAQAL